MDRLTAPSSACAASKKRIHDPTVLVQTKSWQVAGAAVRISQGRGQYVLTLDADLQDDPANLPRMFEQLKGERVDIVSGWRRERQDSPQDFLVTDFQPADGPHAVRVVVQGHEQRPEAVQGRGRPRVASVWRNAPVHSAHRHRDGVPRGRVPGAPQTSASTASRSTESQDPHRDAGPADGLLSHQVHDPAAALLRSHRIGSDAVGFACSPT